jgi:hypothetical protein
VPFTLTLSSPLRFILIGFCSHPLPAIPLLHDAPSVPRAPPAIFT